MRVIAIKALHEFWDKHANAELPLKEWYFKTCRAEWKSFADIKNDFNSVDYVGNQKYVFNIKGNSYRLVVIIKFTPNLVYIRRICTHEEYSKMDITKI